MGEVIRAKYRGRAVGTVQAGWGAGCVLAAVAYGVVFSFFPPQWSWRILFWLGILPALLVVYVRQFVDEPEIFQKTTAESGFDPLGFLKGRHLVTTFLGVIMISGLLGGYYAVQVWLPEFLKSERHLSVIGTSTYSTLVQLGSFTGFVAGAHFADYIGRRATVILFSVISAGATYAYTVMPIGPVLMLFLGFLMGALSSGRMAPTGTILTELYPTAIRGTAQGFVYNFGRAAGAFYPAIAGYAAAHMKLGLAIGVLAVISNGIAVLACFFLPETRNKELLPATAEVAKAKSVGAAH
jgi:MFS family permease